MSALDILEKIEAAGGRVVLEDGIARIKAPNPLPDKLIEQARAHKAELLKALAANDDAEAQRRQKVAQTLRESPELKRALVVDAEGDPVVATIGIRKEGRIIIGELLIVKDKYDPWLFMDAVERCETQ